MKVHFIAIGGSVMHQLALALKMKGYDVSGSDDEIFDPAATNLRAAGIYPEKPGWDAAKITPELDAVILGMHAREDNPELIKARALKIPVYSFPEYIYQESIGKKRVAIAGSHGKTTITSMIMHVLRHNRVDFDYLVGAHLEGFERSVKITHAPLIVCEADEYPASALRPIPKFFFLHPHIAVISGIAWDHMNVFPTFENYCEQFAEFIRRIEQNGTLIYNQGDAVIRSVVEKNKRSDIVLVPYHLPDHKIIRGTTYLNLNGAEFPLKVFGNHNLMNVMAAYEVCKKLGVTDGQFLDAITSFMGASRRLELIYHDKDTSVFRDFAHSPSKVLASTKAVSEQFPGRRLVAVLELHTFSSLNNRFMKEYHGALDMADIPIVFYSEHALELKRMPYLDPQQVKEGFGNKDLAIFTHKEDLRKTLGEMKIKNVNFLFMSSGDYDGLDVLASLGLNN